MRVIKFVCSFQRFEVVHITIWHIHQVSGRHGEAFRASSCFFSPSHWVTVPNGSAQVLLLLRSPLLAVFHVAHVRAKPVGNDVGVSSTKVIELS